LATALPGALLGDARLAAALARSNSVLGLVVSPEVQDTAEFAYRKAGIAHAGDVPGPFLLNFSSAEAPIPNLANAAAGVGALN